MSTLQVLQQLPRLFRYADVQKFSGNANTFLDRALKRSLIERLARGVYINSALKGLPQIEEAACFIRTPCYISCEWALNYHGITIQAPTVCTVLTLSTAVGEARRLVWRGTGIEFSRIAVRLFTGFTMQDGFSIATPEKALLDTIYFRRGLPVHDELELDGVDRALLKQLAMNYPERVSETIRTLFP
jgi:predicted transcriptional regulator of viral defense system